MSAEEIYQLIGQTISDSIEEDWKEAEVDIFRTDKAVKFSGYFITSHGTQKGLEANFRFTHGLAVHELHSIMTAGGKNRWNKLIFKLSKTGTFSIDFIWDEEYHKEVQYYNGQR